MSKFKGFSTPTYTQTPNEFFDIIQSKDISKSEIKILAFMVRNTFGWQRAGFSLQFTFSEIQEHTKMGRQQVRDGLHKCLDKEYIERAEIMGNYVYRLKMDSDFELPWDLKFEWQKVAKKPEQEPQKETKQFENQTKSGLKIKPRAVLKSNQEQFENQTAKNPKSLDFTESEDSLNTSLNKNNKYIIKNNNNKDKKSISQNVSLKKEVALNNTLSVVVDLLQNHEIEINQATVTKWSKLADESTILAATQEALDRPEVKNVIGYVSKILENGYVAPQKAPGLENSKVRSQNETRIRKSELPEWIVRQMNGQVEDDEPISEETLHELFNHLKQLGLKD